MSELEINEENFDRYFFDVRKHKIQPGQIMVCYSAMAEFIAGPEKQNMIDLLKVPNKANAAQQVMRKLLFASETDAVRVLVDIAEDLLIKPEREVLEKPYKYKMEMFFYTLPEYVPDDPHWTTISVIDVSKGRILTEKDIADEKGKSEELLS